MLKFVVKFMCDIL